MSSRDAARGRLFILSAPSGTGKTSVADRLAARVPRIRRSVSYTSRRARGGEVDGEHYHFVTRERFEAMIAGSQFLEWADVFGHLYGTSLVDTERLLAEGDDVLLVIDVQGGRNVRRQRVPSVSIFLLPPSAAELESRLRHRNLDSADVIRRRLDTAREEIQAYAEYDYLVVNDDLDRSVDLVAAIVLAERQRQEAMADVGRRIAEDIGAPGA